MKLDDALVKEGVAQVSAEPGALVLRGPRAHQRVKLDGDFAAVRKLAAQIA